MALKQLFARVLPTILMTTLRRLVGIHWYKVTQFSYCTNDLLWVVVTLLLPPLEGIYSNHSALKIMLVGNVENISQLLQFTIAVITAV